MTDLAHTSVPSWAAQPAGVASATPRLDAVPGASYLVLAVGGPAAALGADLVASVPAARLVPTTDVADASDALDTALEAAQVGLRVVLVGPRGACLALRALAVRAGLEDDELAVHVAGVGEIDIHCAHCRTTTGAMADIGDVVACTGCGRDLVVYHHVSRRTGRYLGYQVDAETLPVAALPAQALPPADLGAAHLEAAS